MRILSIILGIFLIIWGGFLLFNPAVATLMLGWFVAFSALLGGIMLIAEYVARRKNPDHEGAAWVLAGGISSVVIGIIMLFSVGAQAISSLIIVIALGIWIVVTGVVRIVDSFYLRKANKALPEDQQKSTWVWFLILGIILVALGIFALFHIQALFLATGVLVAIEVMLVGINSVVVAIIAPKE